MFNQSDIKKMESDMENVVCNFVKEKLNIKQECLDILKFKIKKFDSEDQSIYVDVGAMNTFIWFTADRLKEMCEGVQNLLTKIEMLEEVNKQSSNNPDGRRKL